MKKIVFLLLVLVGVQTFIYAEQNAQVVATVNGHNITKHFVDKQVQEDLSLLPQNQRTEEKKQALEKKIIEQKIDDLLLIDAAHKYKVEISSTELKNAINLIKTKYKDEKEFKENLKKQGLTEASLKKEIKDNIMKIKYISTEINNRAKKPTDEQLKNFYNNVISRINGLELNLSPQEDKLVSLVSNNLKRIYSEQVKIRQIFIKCLDTYTKEQQKEAKTKIKSLQKELALPDVNFAQLSVKYSDDQVLRQKKGDLGFVLKEDIDPSIAKVVFSLQVGDFNKKPVHTNNGYHFFRVEEKKAKMPIEFDNIKASLSELIYKQNIQDEYDKLLSELKGKADIKIYQK
jgi:parvulin-like peptidyl-prolyl isomerase